MRDSWEVCLNFIEKFIIFFGIAFFVFFIFRDYPNWGRERYCIEKSKVASVGGCDKYGDCGVALENGSGTTHYFPYVGKEICVKYEMRDKQ